MFQALDIPDHLRSALKHARKACVAETNVDEKYIDESKIKIFAYCRESAFLMKIFFYFSGKNGHLADNPVLGCYINCLLEHFGMIESDGSIVWERVLHLLPPSNRETAEYVANECKTVCKYFFSSLELQSELKPSIFWYISVGSNKCETGLLTFKCYFEKAPEVFFDLFCT